ncbi:MAG: hypothetical protein HY263_02675, partial [Chloroflexi bacterium]|nr:hypothetical protein [Chloroflexota bacterium]
VVSAANTRLLYVGDPALVNCNPMTFSTGETYNTTCPTYLVHPTAVSSGYTSYFDVLLKNLGKQTLTSAALGFGDLIADDNGVAGPELPAGWTIVSYASLTGAAPTCTTNGTAGAYTGLSCNFGNLGRGASASIRIVVRAGNTRDHDSSCFDTLTSFTLAPCPALVVSGKVAEAVGGNVGSNNNTFYAYGDEPSGDFPNHAVTDYYVTGAGRIAGLFDKNHGPISPLVPNGITTSVDLFALTSTSQFVVSIDETTAGPSCPTSITTCSPGASTVHVNQGNNVDPYFVWVAQFPVDASFKLSTKTGFIHFFETYDPILHPNDYETFFNVNKTSCSKPGIPCADFTLVGGGTSTAYVEIYFKTAKNGSGKLF